MARIEDYLRQILEARYGEDVRGSIHDSIEMINKIAGIKFGTDITSTSSSSGTFEIGTFYINTSTYDLWCMIGVDSWDLVGNIKGANGQNGSNGANGADAPKITGLNQISHVGLIRTYEFTLDDGSSYTFQVSDGASGSGTGDMTKAVYDTDNDGIVDKAETVGSATTSVLEKLSDVSGQLNYDGNPVGSDYINSVSSDFSVASKTLSLATSIINKLSKLTSSGKLAFSNIDSKPSSLSGYGITDAYTKTEVDGKLDSWFAQTQQATATGEQNVIFTGLDTTKHYELWFDTSDGSQVGMKSSSLSGTTMTYVVDVPDTCPVPVDFKLRIVK